MPTVDDRLEQLFVAAAVEPATDADVFGAVARKRHQRRTWRVARNVGVAVVTVLVLAGSLAWLATDHGTESAVAPTTRDSVASRKLGDAWLGAEPVALTPDLGYVRGPLLQSGEYLEVAAYDRDGAGFRVPPSRVVRLDTTGRVLDDVVLQGEILSFADGEGARWVVTHDADNVKDRQYRVKRIAVDGNPQSNAFPRGVEPTGPIVAAGGAAWVPIEGGVLRFDTATGAYRDEVSLPGWNRIRLVRFGNAVYAYSAFQTQLAQLDGTSTAPPAIVSGDASLVSVAATDTGLWALTRSGGRAVIAPLNPISGAFDARTSGVTLPRRFVASELQASGDAVWVTGTLTDSQKALLRLDTRDHGVVQHSRLVMFRAPNGSTMLGTAGNDVLVAADGVLYRVNLR